MTKERYMALADLQTVWDDKMKPYIQQTFATKGEAMVEIDASPTDGSEKAVSSGGVYTALSGKSNTGHTHTKSEITDFNDGDYAAASHNHDSSYAALSHTHTKSQITDYDNPEAAFVGETLVFYSGGTFSGETLVLG